MNHMNPKDPTLYDTLALPFYGSITFRQTMIGGATHKSKRVK